MQNVKRTTEVSSNIGRGCEHCSESIGLSSAGNSVTDGVNHYIEVHGYRLLHVGTQTAEDMNGKPHQTTVAILGHDDPPAVVQRSASIGFGGKE